MSPSEPNGGNVRPLRRLRVLLASRDPHFVKVIGFLLGRHGYLVTTTRRPAQLLVLVERHRSNVVVLDASDSMTSAARAMAALQALYPYVAVVPVSDLPPGASSFNVQPKWDFANLVEEVEHRYLVNRREKEESVDIR